MRSTSLHFMPLHFASFTSLCITLLYFILDNFSLHFRLFTSLDFPSLHFSMISSTLIQFNYHFPYPPFKNEWFAGEIS